MAIEDNSRPLDVHRWSDHSDVNSFVYKLWDDEFAQKFLPKDKGRKPSSKTKYQFKVLMLDLYVAWKQDPSLRLGVGMSKRSYTASSRYSALHISAIMIQLVKAAQKLGYIDWKIGNEGSGQVTRIWSTQKLIDLFDQAKISEYQIDISDKIEVIILNAKGEDSVAKPIEYDDEDYPAIPQMRLELQDYNALLHNTFIDIGSLEKPIIEKEYWDTKAKKYRVQKVHIRQNNKLVRRIFYRGRWDLGGRFHGGWWQQISSNYRKDILVDDQRTIEVDYSGLHVSLIYCIEGQSPPEDPYTISLQLHGYDAPEQRRVVKGLVLCAINAKSRTAAYQAYRNQQKNGSKQKSLKNADLEKLLDGFIKQNPVVENYIATDKGVELMKLDGDLTAIIINHFTAKNIPILTVHDSYIVPEGQDGEMITVMNKAVNSVLGDHRIRVKQDVTSHTMLQVFSAQDPMDRSHHLQNLKNIPKAERCSGYRDRLNNFNNWKK